MEYVFRPLVVVVSASLSSNALGRALTLASVIPDEFEVQIWGPRAKAIWPGSPLPRFPLLGLRWDSVRAQAIQLNDAVRAGRKVVVWISKGYPLAAHLVRNLHPGIPVIADYDDHDVALAHEYRGENILNAIRLPAFRSGSPERVAHAQQSIQRRAQAVTVSSNALGHALGIRTAWTRVPHARAELEVAERSVPIAISLGFLGTIRPHKGLHEVYSALRGDKSLQFVTFAQHGLTPPPDLASRWMALDPETSLSDAYRQVDVAVLPMDTRRIGSRLQFPAKAVDAASAGIPIAANRTPVLDEYFGVDLISVHDWSNLGLQLKALQQTGELERTASRIHTRWKRDLSLSKVRTDVEKILVGMLRQPRTSA